MKLLKDEKGFIAVETITLFAVFYMALILILLLVNISSAQLRIHHALAQIANEEVFMDLVGRRIDSIDGRDRFAHHMDILGTSTSGGTIAASDYLQSVRVQIQDEFEDAVTWNVIGNTVTVSAEYTINFLPFRLILGNSELLQPTVSQTVQMRRWVGDGD